MASDGWARRARASSFAAAHTRPCSSALPVESMSHPPAPLAENERFLAEIAAANAELSHEVQRSLAESGLPVAMGGDHSIAIGSIAGCAAHFRKQGQKIGLIWLDAHGDLNTAETTPSGNIHGMPLAATLGFGSTTLTKLLGFAPKISLENCALVGVRDLDEGERDLIRGTGLRV